MEIHIAWSDPNFGTPDIRGGENFLIGLCLGTTTGKLTKHILFSKNGS